MRNYKLLKVLLDLISNKLKYNDLKLALKVYKIHESIEKDNTNMFTSVNVEKLKEFTLSDIKRLIEIHNKYTKNKKIGDGFILE